MSSDNCIGVLRTLCEGKGYEYRVAHIIGLDNLDWDAEKVNDDGTKGGETNDPDVQIVNARGMWHGCQVYRDEHVSLTVASEMAKDIFPLEYGIISIQIDRVFDHRFDERFKDNTYNLVLTYGSDEDILAGKAGCKFLGAARDRNGGEVHVWERVELSEFQKGKSVC